MILLREMHRVLQRYLSIEYFQAVERLENFPLSGRIVPEFGQEYIREIIFGSYRIVYLVGEEEVSILTVFHSSRLLKVSDLPNETVE